MRCTKLKQKKTLILINDKNRYFWKWTKNNSSYDIKEVFIKKIGNDRFKKKNPNGIYISKGIFGSWILQLWKYDKIIVFDSSYTSMMDDIIARFVKKKENKAYFYYWNKMNLDSKLAIEQMENISKDFEIYSYNKNDCEQYKLKYNSTLAYPINQGNEEESIDVRYDVIWGGAVIPDRCRQLDEVLNEFNKYNISYYIDAKVDSKYKNCEMSAKNYEIKTQGLEYEQYISLVKKSRAILNLDKYPQMGLSVRAIEALFYHKKYITDNPDVKDEPFYNGHNVFVLGEDSIEMLPQFIKEPYLEYDENIVNYYSIEEWVKRFV